MLKVAMPKTFKVGDTADCQINGKPERLTWRDNDTLVIEPDDARKIASVYRSRGLIHFTCGATGVAGSEGAWDGPRRPKKRQARRDYWWLDLNGTTVAACSIPLSQEAIGRLPTPKRLIGFPTQTEQLEAQRILLYAEMAEVARRMDEWLPRMHSGEIALLYQQDRDHTGDIGATANGVSDVKRSSQHKQVRIQVGDYEADVDEELAPLIEQLWRAGLRTVLSCQENRPGVAWIMFATQDDLCRFLDIVAEYDPEDGSLYRRVSQRTSAEEGCWEYDLHLEDAAVYEEEMDDSIIDWHDGEACFYFSASARFPRTDLPMLLDRMVRHNACLEDECEHGASAVS